MLPWIRRRRLEAIEREHSVALARMVQDTAALKTQLLEARAATEADRLLAGALRERVLVTLRDTEDAAFEGLLVDADQRTLVLVNAMQLSRGGVRIGVDGALYLERSRVDYLQRPGGLPAPGESA